VIAASLREIAKRHCSDRGEPSRVREAALQ
jgi:hypothetical protein